MYLSRLILENPPRHRQLRRDLAWPYEMHRTLMRAFPKKGCGEYERVLFRLEPTGRNGIPLVIVQSDQTPDWSFFQDIPGYLHKVDTKPFQPHMKSGQPCRFRLRANPTRKVGTSGKKEKLHGLPTNNGRRIGLLTEDEQRRWLDRKGAAGGFTVDIEGLQVIQEDSPRNMAKGFQEESGGKRILTLLSVRYEGALTISDPDRLAATLRRGIGPGKAFGFGLLSLAPL